MVVLRHRRVQYPVGHGFFHGGRVGVAIDGGRICDTYEYVVDCGGPAVAEQVQRYPGRHLNALILTHLHADHTNGLRNLLRLTKGCDIAIVPYLAPIERILLAARQSVGRYSVDGDLLADPRAWLTKFGAKRVLFVSGGSGGEPDPEPGDPDGPFEPPPEERPGERATAWELQPPPKEADIGPQGREELTGGGTHVSHRGSAPLMWNGQPAWRLRFWAKHPDPASYKTFLNEIWKAFPAVQNVILSTPTTMVAKPNGQKAAAIIRDIVTDDLGTLKKCYQKAFTKGQKLNETSLCILSEPAVRADWYGTVLCGGTLCTMPRWGRRREEQDCDLSWDRSDFWRYWDYERPYLHPGLLYDRFENIGWLGTGDAVLRTQKQIKEMVDHFFRDGSRVSDMSMPHHGSRHNSNPALYNRIGPSRVLATGKTSSPHHPAKSVVAMARAAGACVQVSEAGGPQHVQDFVGILPKGRSVGRSPRSREATDEVAQ